MAGHGLPPAVPSELVLLVFLYCDSSCKPKEREWYASKEEKLEDRTAAQVSYVFTEREG